MNLRELLNVAFAVGWGCVLFLAYRWILRRSAVLGTIVALGVLIRSVLGLLLFWVSYLHLPVLRSFQLGQGFWSLTPDARSYYTYAAAGVDAGIWRMYPGDSSPFFVRILAAWMDLVGVSPAAAFFLNLSIYMGLCVLLVRACRPRNDWRADLPCEMSAAAFTFSPVAVIHGTQPLKEDLFGLLIGLVCVSSLWLTQALIFAEPAGRQRVRYVAGVALIFAASFGIAGIRPYYAVIVWLAMALTLGACGFANRTQLHSRYLQYVTASILVLAAVWFAYWQGSGTGYWGPRLSAAPQPSNAFVALQQVRTGFILTGGGTSLVSVDSVQPGRLANKLEPGGNPDVDSGEGTASQPVPGQSVTHLIRDGQMLRRTVRSVSVGLAAEFIPISLLKKASVVSFTGGHGLLPIADFDTVFVDASLLACLSVVFRRRQDIGHRLPFVVCMLSLSLITSCLLAYVVTNFGSLFRIKTIVAVPIWVLCLAVMPEHRPWAPRHD